MGFDELGPVLAPARLVELVQAASTRDIGDPLSGQAPALLLGRQWAISMGPDVEESTLSAVVDPATEALARGHLAGMLLSRDWRHFAPELVRQAAEIELAGGDAVDLRAVYQNIAGAYRRCEQVDRPHYFDLVASNPSAALALAAATSREDAEFVLAQPAALGSESVAFDLLRSRFALDEHERIAACRRVLEDDTSGAAARTFVVQNLLHSTAAATDDFVLVLEAEFEARGSEGSIFWNALSVPLSDLSDLQVLDGIVPWLERSSGEKGYVRAQLLAAVKSRYPSLAHLE